MRTLMVSIIIIHNMSSVTLKKNSGLRVGSYTETTTPMAIHARVDLKNSLRPEIKFNTNPCQQDHSVDKFRLHRKL